jgi:hypothetical protein
MRVALPVSEKAAARATDPSAPPGQSRSSGAAPGGPDRRDGHVAIASATFAGAIRAVTSRLQGRRTGDEGDRRAQSGMTLACALVSRETGSNRGAGWAVLGG